MKKVLTGIVFLGIAALGLALVSCGNKSSASASPSARTVAGGEVNVYNWSVYLPDEVKAQFTKETGIKLNYKEYGSNEEMYATLASGDQTWDIVFPSQDYVPVLMEKGMAEELDKSKIPNEANIDASVLAAAAEFDPGNKFSVPYNIGTTGIMYWKDKVTISDQSWSALQLPAVKGHTTMLDDMREVMGAALSSLGYSLNTTDPAQISKAVDVVQKWKTFALKPFDNDGMSKNFASKNYWLVFGYPENVLSELDPKDQANVGFFLPKEGGPKYLDSFVILKTAKNKDNAYAFINFILRPDVLSQIDDAYGYPGISAKANALRKSQPYYSTDDLTKRELKKNLGTAVDLYNKAWEEKIKIGQ